LTTAHRADYLLDRGVWYAKCRCCGFQVAHDARRRAAAEFRLHIRDMRAGVIDLSSDRSEGINIDVTEAVEKEVPPAAAFQPVRDQAHSTGV
jgi:hypothetical protein